jgi:dTDP-4-amino-4,6-dideoxygalactose transaminase
LVDDLRIMGNFGFGEPRTATMPGLNSKLSEIAALVTWQKLQEFEGVVAHRAALAERYRAELPGWTFQQLHRALPAYQFMPALLPALCMVACPEILAGLAKAGVTAEHYFSPHLAEQPYFRSRCVSADLPVTDRLAARILSLLIADEMTVAEVSFVCSALQKIVENAG